MKSLISILAVAAVMGIAAAATPAAANTADGKPNTCVVVDDTMFNFGVLKCTHKYPWWYTPLTFHVSGSDQPMPTGKKECERGGKGGYGEHRGKGKGGYGEGGYGGYGGKGKGGFGGFHH